MIKIITNDINEKPIFLSNDGTLFEYSAKCRDYEVSHCPKEGTLYDLFHDIFLGDAEFMNGLKKNSFIDGTYFTINVNSKNERKLYALPYCVKKLCPEFNYESFFKIDTLCRNKDKKYLFNIDKNSIYVVDISSFDIKIKYNIGTIINNVNNLLGTIKSLNILKSLDNSINIDSSKIDLDYLTSIVKTLDSWQL